MDSSSKNENNLTTLKKVLLNQKRFFKFYKNEFIPITIHEKNDKETSLKRINYAKILGFLIFFFGSSQLRKIRLSFVKNNNTLINTDSNSFFSESLNGGINCLIVGLSGYLIMHFLSLNILFNHTEYIRRRMQYERSIGFNRSNVTSLYDDYPFVDKDKFLFSDLHVRNKLNLRKQID